METHYFGLSPNTALSLGTVVVLLGLLGFEWLSGRYRNGRKTPIDWQMFGMSTAGIVLVERPLMFAAVYAVADRLPPLSPSLSRMASEHLAVSVLLFIAVDELLHGWAHTFAHGRVPDSRTMARLHAFYREAHRAHHLVGGEDGRGEVSASHAIVAGWGWMLFLPNYWFGAAVLGAGLTDTWLWGMLLKNIWGMHVHTNWRYDLYLLNHPNRWIRGTMFALCHVLTFPHQHHHHHARGRNSARNMQNVLSLYDWLLWKTLSIETAPPAHYGWKPRPRERSALYRYFNRPLRIPRRLGAGTRAS